MSFPFTPPPMCPWAPGVRAIDVPIAEGGDPSPFADLDNIEPNNVISRAPVSASDVPPSIKAAEQ
jgi:hypothetical protein